MVRVTLRWTMIALAVALLGPIAAWLCRPIRGLDGGPVSTMLVGTAVAPAIVRTLLVFALALLFGAGVSKILGWRLGSFVAGVTLAWPAIEHSGVSQLVRIAGETPIMTKLAIEGGVLLAMVLGIAWILHRLDPGIDKLPDAVRGVVPGAGGVIAGAMAAGTLAMFVVLLVAIGDQRMQIFAAAIVGALLAGTVARFIGPGPGPVTAMLGLVLAAIAAPLLTGLMAGDDLVESAYLGSMLNLGRLTPMMWASGALIGVPIGSSWAESMLERQPQSTATA